MFLKKFIASLSSLGDLALCLLRIILGIVLIYHGYGKITHGFAIGFFAHIGFPIPAVIGVFITLLELIGGICLIIGLFTRYLGVLYTIEFIVAWLVIIGSRGWGGSEREVLIIFVSFVLATLGSGRWSIDKGRPWEP